MTNNHDYDNINMIKKDNNHKNEEGGGKMLAGKKIAILGDRDGIPGPAIEEALKSTEAEVVFTTTECFV